MSHGTTRKTGFKQKRARRNGAPFGIPNSERSGRACRRRRRRRRNRCRDRNRRRGHFDSRCGLGDRGSLHRIADFGGDFAHHRGDCCPCGRCDGRGRLLHGGGNLAQLRIKGGPRQTGSAKRGDLGTDNTGASGRGARAGRLNRLNVRGLCVRCRIRRNRESTCQKKSNSLHFQNLSWSLICAAANLPIDIQLRTSALTSN